MNRTTLGRTLPANLGGEARMDYRFWLPIAINVLGLVLLHRQNEILRRSRQVSDKTGKYTHSSENAFFHRWWPIGVMLFLMSGAWLPYILLGHELPETNLQFTISPQQVTKSPEGKWIPFAEGKQASFNIYFTNQGPKDALDCRWKGTIELVTSPSSIAAEEETWRDFDENTMWLGPVDLIPKQNVWKTFRTRVLTAADIQDIRSGRLLLYVFAHGQFKDGTGQHEVELCSYVEPPGDDPTWVNCNGHNLNR